MIYLDNAATAKHTYIDELVIGEMTKAMRKYWMNPSSLYATNVKEEINICREKIAKFIGAKSNEIIFTSGASESNNFAIRGWIDDSITRLSLQPHIITTPIEHKSILSLLKSNVMDTDVDYCEIDEAGFVDTLVLKDMLNTFRNIKGQSVLVSIGLANNEIGTIQHIEEIAEIVHNYGAIFHVDATQVFGKIPIDVEELGMDMMSASGHKISPVLKGVGFLYKKNSINIQPLIYGAQENGLRGGTENTFGIVGLAEAIEYCNISNEKFDEMCEKRDHFIRVLKDKFGCKLNGSLDYRLPNNINVTFPQNITGESLLYMLDTSNIQISTGSACNSKTIEPSYVLKAIGLTNEEAMRTIRITLSDDILYSEINRIVEEIDKAIKLMES